MDINLNNPWLIIGLCIWGLSGFVLFVFSLLLYYQKNQVLGNKAPIWPMFFLVLEEQYRKHLRSKAYEMHEKKGTKKHLPLILDILYYSRIVFFTGVMVFVFVVAGKF